MQTVLLFGSALYANCPYSVALSAESLTCARGQAAHRLPQELLHYVAARARTPNLAQGPNPGQASNVWRKTR